MMLSSFRLLRCMMFVMRLRLRLRFKRWIRLSLRIVKLWLRLRLQSVKCEYKYIQAWYVNSSCWQRENKKPPWTEVSSWNPVVSVANGSTKFGVIVKGFVGSVHVSRMDESNYNIGMVPNPCRLHLSCRHTGRCFFIYEPWTLNHDGRCTVLVPIPVQSTAYSKYWWMKWRLPRLKYLGLKGKKTLYI
jgi:hypothetical protein